jgi:hypothetical protein
MSSMRWGGAELSVGPADQPPAALMDGPVMGPADKGQVRQIGRATIYPMPQMMGVTPGQGPITAREDTPPVPHRQRGPLGRLDDPGRPADLQRLAGGAAQGRGQRGGSRPQLRLDVVEPGAWATDRWSPGSGRPIPPASPGWRVTRTRVTVPSQASRRHASGGNGPGHPRSPPRLPGRARRLSRSTVTSSCGRTPPALVGQPPSLQRPAGQLRQRISPPLATGARVVGVGRASQRLQGGQHGGPGLRVQQPLHRTIPAQVGDNHNPRRS